MGRLGVCVVDTLRVLRDDGVWRMQPEDVGAPRKPSNFKQEGELGTREAARCWPAGGRVESLRRQHCCFVLLHLVMHPQLSLQVWMGSVQCALVISLVLWLVIVLTCVASCACTI